MTRPMLGHYAEQPWPTWKSTLRLTSVTLMAGGWGGNDESESVSLDGEDVNDFSSGWENIYNKDVNEEDCEWEEIGKPPSTLNNKVHPKPTTRSCDFLSLSEL